MKPAEFDASVARIKADLEAARQRASTLPGMGKQQSSGGGKAVKKWSDL
jgi:hypothetical protein